MLEQLRGRNLAHVGCTLGLTLGLMLGLIFGFLVILLLNSDAGLTWGTLAFFATVAGLGVAGYVLGAQVTKRLWGEERARERG